MSDSASNGAALTQGAAPLKYTNAVPPSLGKTAIVAGSVPLAVQKLLVDTLGANGPLPHGWFTTDYATNIVIIGIALVGWVMHSRQRTTENNNA